jgi:hypothetical protein
MRFGERSHVMKNETDCFADLRQLDSNCLARLGKSGSGLTFGGAAGSFFSRIHGGGAESC